MEAYRWLGETWQAALLSLDIDTHLLSIAEARAAPAPLPEVVRLACFGTLSPYEVTAGGRKIVGLAQVRRRGNVLLQSGLHLDFDAASLARSLGYPDDLAISALHAAATGLREFRPDLSLSEVVSAFEHTLTDTLGVHFFDAPWTPQELAYAVANPVERLS